MPEQFVIVYIDFCDVPGLPYWQMEDEDWSSLLRSLEAAIADAAVGTFDGEDLTDTDLTLSMHGPDADALFAAAEPALRASDRCQGAYAVKIYGDPDDPATRRETVVLDPPTWYDLRSGTEPKSP